MKPSVNDTSYGQLLRVDRDSSGELVLATYKQPDGRYITYKNTKPIGWYSTQLLALATHEWYFEVNFLWPKGKIGMVRPIKKRK